MVYDEHMNVFARLVEFAMRPQCSALLGLLILSLSASAAHDAHASPSPSQQECIANLVKNAPDSMTMGQARTICDEGVPDTETNEAASLEVDETKIVEDRISVDKTNIFKPFTLMSHRNNYILLGAYNFHGRDTSDYQEVYKAEDIEADNTEVQFQLSIKTPLAVDLFNQRIDLFAAYTVRSFWQLYNSDVSSPFRETNHEPEVWLQLRSDWEIFGFQNNISALGLNHMSNGQGGTLSRSWNRIYAAIAFERGNLVFMLRPWIRIEEDFEDDDNPDITDYYGHGELWMAYKYKKHTFSLMTRNNLESGFSRGAVELGWSFPLFGYPFLKGYLQYFSGYGESLVDYNHYVNRIGLGLQLTDIL